ncbi:MAG: glutamate-5-semialdehyde dehydrogenase [Oscillospiraceae bacterium]|nr:glutamate-5-semialdehyde dehydrogenase [Oscillospiraceae bacterium]MDY2678146.1 glutamate-5-semialdehyde dehydrogenase [Oscillospiraceae bacterium]
MKPTKEILKEAKAAKSALSSLSAEEKNEALLKMAESLVLSCDKILEENKKDLADAKGKISNVMLDRLALSKERIEGMSNGIKEVVLLPDPVGRVLERVERPNGLIIEKTSIPLGVTAIIYESRPNVTSDAAALSLKSGNVCVLRSGKEAFRSAKAIVDAMREGLARCDLPKTLINLVEDTTRESAKELMEAVGFVDLLIPRGGAGLIKACTENAKVPCIQTGTGICHIYVEKTADFDMALNIIENAKVQRPSVCNAAEVLLVDSDIAERFLPMLKERLSLKRSEQGLVPVEFFLDERAAKIIDGTKALETSFDTEFLDYKMAVAVVDGVNEAVSHIALHSTGHSEAIITRDECAAEVFTSLVDSAAVYVNASTRFTDGGEFGLGCEMGISTQKLHPRGPMGLKELTTYKYIIKGNGQIR